MGDKGENRGQDWYLILIEPNELFKILKGIRSVQLYGRSVLQIFKRGQRTILDKNER